MIVRPKVIWKGENAIYCTYAGVKVRWKVRLERTDKARQIWRGKGKGKGKKGRPHQTREPGDAQILALA